MFLDLVPLLCPPVRQKTEQAVQDSGSPTRIGDGAVARHSEAIGDQLARGLLETFAADDARSELLHIEEREAELRESVRLQIGSSCHKS